MYLDPIDLGCFKDEVADRDFPTLIGTFVYLQDDSQKTQARAECIIRTKELSDSYTYIALQHSNGECYATTDNSFGKHGPCDEGSPPAGTDILVSELASLSSDGTYGQLSYASQYFSMSATCFMATPELSLESDMSSLVPNPGALPVQTPF